VSLQPIVVSPLDVRRNTDAAALVAELLAAAVEDLAPVYRFLRQCAAETAPVHATSVAIVMASLMEAAEELQALE
jgi:hypothetical protein